MRSASGRSLKLRPHSAVPKERRRQEEAVRELEAIGATLANVCSTVAECSRAAEWMRVRMEQRAEMLDAATRAAEQAREEAHAAQLRLMQSEGVVALLHARLEEAEARLVMAQSVLSQTESGGRVGRGEEGGEE
jgi:hypothetical protein